MKNSVLIAAVLYSFCWTSGSVSGSEILTVHQGEDVTLQSANMFSDGSVTFWLRVINQTKTSCISVINGVHTTIDYCEGFDRKSFEMTVNFSNVLLKIKRVNISDTGIYICGRYQGGELKFTVQHLHVIEKPNYMMLFVIPGSGIVVLLIIVIILIIQVMKIQKAADGDTDHHQHQIPDSTEQSRPAEAEKKRKRRRAPPEPEVVYASSKKHWNRN
ncbi:uncharacterized protein LOC103140653 [Poecilia formosa]|uniref:Uncharacterized LOC103140653 n=1 Tax=Poecilia formosa TaxID=48698 RepID=A0A087Y0Q9_POEFO|nr:PREDICTED: uncharacterized protein LOC103140653 [Poecilia formosa]